MPGVVPLLRFMVMRAKHRAIKPPWGSCKDREICGMIPISSSRGRFCLLRHARAHLLHLYAQRVLPRTRAPAGSDRRGLRRQAHRQDQWSRLGLRLLCASWRRRLHLRRRDGSARKPRRQEGSAAAEAAVPGRLRSLRRADHGQQRRDDRGRARHPAPRRNLVRDARQAEQHRHQAVPDFGARGTAVRGGRGDGHPAPGTHKRACGRRARRLEQPLGRHPRRLRRCRACRPACATSSPWTSTA